MFLKRWFEFASVWCLRTPATEDHIGLNIKLNVILFWCWWEWMDGVNFIPQNKYGWVCDRNPYRKLLFSFLPSNHQLPLKSRLPANVVFCIPLQEGFLSLLLITMLKSFLFFLVGWNGGYFSLIWESLI